MIRLSIQPSHHFLAGCSLLVSSAASLRPRRRNAGGACCAGPLWSPGVRGRSPGGGQRAERRRSDAGQSRSRRPRTARGPTRGGRRRDSQGRRPPQAARSPGADRPHPGEHDNAAPGAAMAGSGQAPSTDRGREGGHHSNKTIGPARWTDRGTVADVWEHTHDSTIFGNHVL